MPIYEYKCPKGHVFETFQRMSDDPVEICEVCGESPVVRVLYPVAVHYKGSGFYSTDYGRTRKNPRDSGGTDTGAGSESKSGDSGSGGDSGSSSNSDGGSSSSSSDGGGPGGGDKPAVKKTAEA